MPGRRAGGQAGALSVYTLGIFSGMASACCAPVLAGVIALSSVAATFWLALGLGTAYVFGMVAPLFIISLLWERYDWRASRLFRPRTFTWRLGALQRTLSATNLATGTLLSLIGGGMVWIGLAYNAMPSPTGWQAQFAVALQHDGAVISRALAWVPNWVAIVLLLMLVALLVRRALRQITQDPGAAQRSATMMQEEP
jgi:cytochrome c-type biogenesis protein